MNHEPNNLPLQLLAAIVICCAAASLGIAALAFCLLRDLSGTTLWAVTAMVAAPSVMGIAVAGFMTKHRSPEAKATASRLQREPGASGAE